jgi:2-hydroxychromene-2-carboxylate isomerase
LGSDGISDQGRGLPIADLVNAVMRAIWSEDQDVSDLEVLVAIAGRHGIDATDLIEAARTETVRAEYRDNAGRALAAGVFGSPFYAFAGELFWGHDRLDMLQEAIDRFRKGDLGRSPGAKVAVVGMTAQRSTRSKQARGIAGGG